MAGKARRAAARQGQLNRKRKKGQRGPTGIPSAVDVAEKPEALDAAAASGDVAVGSAGASDGATASGVAQAVAEPQTAPAPRPSTAARTHRPATSPQGSGRIRGERPAAYNFVGAELRRISILSAAVFAALVVLGILL